MLDWTTFAIVLHGSLGWWDEIISYSVFIIVALVVGAFLFQTWREKEDEEVGEQDGQS